ncbi:hypothetical protein [Cellulomonas marina]|uniref:Uncharacterized protein n=1 Tax=Cellulomonas marina TaxID=988821 RepID=A0A1I0ZRJ1_9CELL|nr:hypothetical protein [Cellulomonas marina]GIG28811.1 hypothetical protein Cma02nite_14110 [Cellulomonas marina]SFB28275.1 hypothetical protein SAMN05421867_11284 [Cellulomonas marina]
MPVLDVPRSVLLAAWLTGPFDRARLVAAVQRDDEPHRVVGLADDDRPLSRLVDACADEPREVACLLPGPGDPPPGLPPALTAAAVAAGECLLVRTPTVCLAAVPEVQRFGSALEPGHLVTWQVAPVPDWRRPVLGAVPLLDEADRALRTGLAEATDALVRLDVARWRPELGERLAELRADSSVTSLLPPGLAGARVRLLLSAVRLRAVVALATVDDGAAVTVGQADRRLGALRDVDRSARRALGAAVTSELRTP